MENYKIIKLLLPTNQVISIQFGGDENELKELISAITDLAPSQIKGIKDQQGNYYTISSALNSQLMQRKQNEYFQLIWNSNKPQVTQKTSFDDFPFHNVNHTTGHYYYFNNQIQQRRDFDYDYDLDFFNQQNLYQIYLKKFLDEKQICNAQYLELIKLVTTKNPELLKSFNLFIQSKIDTNTFIKTLWYICSKLSSTNSSINLFSSNSFKQNDELLLSQIESCFSPENFNIIKEMIKYENENVKTLIREYNKDHNYPKFIEALKSYLYTYKSKSNHFRTKPKSSLNLGGKRHLSAKKTTKSPNRVISSTDHKELTPTKTLFYSVNFTKPSSNTEKNPFRSTKMIKRLRQKRNPNLITHSLAPKAPKTPKNVKEKRTKQTSMKSSVMLKYLNNTNKIILKYLKAKSNENYEKLKKCYKENNASKDVEKIMNDKCAELFQGVILKSPSNKTYNMNQSDIGLMFQMIKEKNPEISKIFEEFNTSMDLAAFQKELFDILTRERPDKGSSEDSGDDSKEDINALFIAEMSTLNLSQKDKDKLMVMLKSSNAKLIGIVNDFAKTRKISDVKNQILALLTNRNKGGSILTKLKMRESPKRIIFKKPSKDLKVQIKKPSANNLSNYKNILTYFSSKNLLTPEQCELLTTKYEAKDDLVLSFFEYYFQEKDLDELQESLVMYLKKHEAEVPKPKQKTPKDITKTPDAVKKSKNELICFLKKNNKEISKEEKNVLEKQKEIIYLLYKENLINQKIFSLINKKIEEDVSNLIGAFEVYAVTKDHNDFIETLTLIAELSENFKGTFYTLLNGSKFSEAQKKKLISLYEDKDSYLMSALQLYDQNKDKEDVIDSLSILLSKKNK